MPSDDPRTDDFNPWRLAGMGTELLGSIVGPGLIGYLIDRWAGTLPTWTIVLACLGIVGGGYNFVRQAMALNRQAAAAYRRRPRAAASTPARGSGGGLFDRESPTDLPDDVDFPPDDDDPRPPGGPS